QRSAKRPCPLSRFFLSPIVCDTNSVPRWIEVGFKSTGLHRIICTRWVGYLLAYTRVAIVWLRVSNSLADWTIQLQADWTIQLQADWIVTCQINLKPVTHKSAQRNPSPINSPICIAVPPQSVTIVCIMP